MEQNRELLLGAKILKELKLGKDTKIEFDNRGDDDLILTFKINNIWYQIVSDEISFLLDSLFKKNFKTFDNYIKKHCKNIKKDLEGFEWQYPNIEINNKNIEYIKYRDGEIFNDLNTSGVKIDLFNDISETCSKKIIKISDINNCTNFSELSRPQLNVALRLLKKSIRQLIEFNDTQKENIYLSNSIYDYYLSNDGGSIKCKSNFFYVTKPLTYGWIGQNTTTRQMLDFNIVYKYNPITDSLTDNFEILKDAQIIELKNLYIENLFD